MTNSWIETQAIRQRLSCAAYRKLAELKAAFPDRFAQRVQLRQIAALYFRVSTADQTCARQERNLRAFATKSVSKLAQARKIDVILGAELTRWGRAMTDLLHTLQDLQAWGVSLVAQTGLQFNLRAAQGKLIASLMATLAEFEGDLLRERVRSGIAGARKRGVVVARQLGQRIKAGRYTPRVLKLAQDSQSYREISHRLEISEKTVLDNVTRDRAA